MMKKLIPNLRVALPLAAVVVLALGAALYVVPATGKEKSAAPQAANGQNWSVRCQDVKEGEKAGQKYCETFQRLSMKQKDKDGKAQDPKRLIEFAVGYVEDKKARGVMVLPLGVMVEEPLEIEIDGKNKFNFRVRYCQPGGCLAFLSLNEATLKKMAAGESLTVKATAMNGQELSIPMSLKGFGPALEKAKAGA